LDGKFDRLDIHRPDIVYHIWAAVSEYLHLEVPMKVWRYDTLGDLSGLALHEEEKPKPGVGEVLVRLHAVSLNTRDVMIAEQRYAVPGKAGVVALSDGCGEIVGSGPAVTRFKAGDRVMTTYFPQWRDGRLSFAMAFDQFGCTRDGVAAEYAVFHQDWLVAVPDHLSFEEASTLPCAALTAWTGLTSLPRPVLPGDRVLTMGTGGVPIFALQFAKAMGAEVVSLTSSEAKATRLKALGADHVINYKAKPDWEKEIATVTSGRGIDHIVETGGLPTFERSLKSVSADGQIASIGVLRATDAAINATVLGAAYATIRRIFVGSRAGFEAMNRAIGFHKIRPVIDHVSPFESAKDELSALKAQKHFGKVVISIA
jgi:NADPH:quinone reductase-like Zn-dependent oxidoreductase